MDYRNILERKLDQIFQNPNEREMASRILESYGQEEHEQEPQRVRLAILKLCGEIPTLDEIKTNTKSAKQDYWDILTWAEYPRQGKSCSIEDGSKMKRMKRADREEYALWFNT